ncbi:MAG: adenosine deaminase [Oscillospiraceae bacterium]|nr:adenosine deaminase [Oscillospiraceae bacterium]
MTSEALKKMPKIELHCHLDGSLSKKFIEKQLGREVSYQELSVSQDCKSLDEYLDKFDLPLKCLTTEEEFQKAGYDILESMSSENICYAEIRFAPLLSAAEDMGTEKIIEALLAGLEKGKKRFGTEYNVIVCAMRHHNAEENYKMIKAARNFLGEGVCAADLAGAEALYPMSDFINLFEQTRKIGMPFTIHAGECGNAKNIRDSIMVGAKRIGHGIAMRGNREIQLLAKNAGVGIEMCPISNLQTKSVGNVSEYPLREFLDEGLLVTINTDNRTVSNTSMTKEFEFIQKNYGIRDEEIKLLVKNAVEVSFADDDLKEKLRCMIIKEFS